MNVKMWLVLLIMLVLFLPVVVFAEETERERLVRIETKLDVLIQNDQQQVAQYEKIETRVGLIEQVVTKHSSWWTLVWSIIGVFGTTIVGLVVKAFWGVLFKAPIAQEVKT